MPYKIIETEPASRDLDRIMAYIAEDLANPIAASDLIREIDRTYELLEEMPRMFEMARSERLAKAGCRKALVKHYVMLYQVDDQAQTVSIIRFFHASQDYAKLL